jgi:hypothetical protein
MKTARRPNLLIITYKENKTEGKTMIPISTILKYSKKNSWSAAEGWLKENYPTAKLTSVSLSY